MSHGRRRARKSLGAPEADGEIGDLKRVEEGERLLFAALQVKREGGPRARAMTLEDVRLARSVLEEAEVADLLHLRMALQIIADLRGIFAGAAHAHLQSL